MKKAFLAAALAAGLAVAPLTQAQASITLTTAEAVLVVVGSTALGSHIHNGMMKHKAHYMHKRHMRGVSLSADDVRGLQTYLNEQGCDAGAVDGVWGPKTSAAVSRCF